MTWISRRCKFWRTYIDHFAGPVLAVSHDRLFLDRTCEKIFAFEGAGRVDIHTGNYTDYAERRQSQPQADKAPFRQKRQRNRPPPARAQGQISYKEAREYETIEAEIDALEQNLARNEADMAANSSDFVRLNDLMAEKNAARRAASEQNGTVGVFVTDSGANGKITRRRMFSLLDGKQ